MSLLAACSVSDDAVMADAALSIDSPSDIEQRNDAGASDETESAEAGDAESGEDEATDVAASDEADAASDGTIEVAEADEASDPAAGDGPSAVTALSEVEEEEAKPSPFAKLFSRSGDTPPQTEQPAQRGAPAASRSAEPATEDGSGQETDATTTASIASSSPQVRLSVAGDGPTLPGVREVRSIYEIPQRDHFDYTDYSEEDGAVQLASAVGLAALAGRQLAVQHANVDVSCFKPRLVGTLRQIESHFGRPVVVTSGFRSKKHNRRVGGARESQHMNCDAADIQVAGVSKWDIAEYVRSLPGRGGVGTYCHTQSVHVDIGKKRDWNWRCHRGN